MTSKSFIHLQVELKLIIKLYFLLFNSTAVSLGKPPSDKPKPQTWYIHRTAHSVIYIIIKKKKKNKNRNTHSTLEQSLKIMSIMVIKEYITRLPMYHEMSKTGKKVRYKKKSLMKKLKDRRGNIFNTVISIRQTQKYIINSSLTSSCSVSFFNWYFW